MLTCSVLPELTGYLPRSNIDLKHFNIPANIQLADPSFNDSKPVQMLIGSDLFWEIIGSEQKSPASHSSLENLNDQIAKFWETEDLPKYRHFLVTVRRLVSNIFVLTLGVYSQAALSLSCL
ncbi:unnamed protein product [Euphydryas editha]|uniref:Uncharacterized protein n=1 Tax=Euphydryas editha TaxID=104508 RepID=A0AAU9U6E7_EUPED|nr:unnamed protein product [Euphydryas editha]